MDEEYLIPMEDVPVFMNTIGISLQDLIPFLIKKMCSYQSKETLNNFKHYVTPEQYAKTMTRFGKYRAIVGFSFDRLFYAPICYAVLRYGEKTVKGKSGKRFGQLADNMKKHMTDINFNEPIKLTQINIEFLKEDMRLNP